MPQHLPGCIIELDGKFYKNYLNVRMIYAAVWSLTNGVERERDYYAETAYFKMHCCYAGNEK